MQGDLKKVKFSDSIDYYRPMNIFSKILPILLFLSFVWLDLYSTLGKVSQIDILGGGDLSTIIFGVLVVGLFEYVVFELLFFIYRFCLGFSIYSFLIPKQVLVDKFRLWYVIRNVILGLIYNLRFFFPYIGTFLCVAELVCNMLFILCLYFNIAKDYVEPLVGQYVFRALSVPVFLYSIYRVIVLMVGVL